MEYNSLPANRLGLHDTTKRLYRKARAIADDPPINSFANPDNLLPAGSTGFFGIGPKLNCLTGYL